MEFYKRVISGTTYLSYDICSDTIDEVSLGMLSNNKIAGVLDLNVLKEEEKVSLNYNISSQISLEEYLSGLVEKNKLIKTLTGITDAILSAQEYMLEYKQLVPEMSYIYIEPETGEVSLLFLPIEEYHNHNEISKFIKEILFSIQFDLKAGTNYVAEINNYLGSATNLYLEDFKKFLENINRRDKFSSDMSIKSDKVMENNLNISPMHSGTSHSVENNAKEQTNIKEDKHTNPIENKNIPKVPASGKKSFLIPGSEKPVQALATKKEAKKSIFSLFGKKKDSEAKQEIKESTGTSFVSENIGETTVLSGVGFDETTVLSSSNFATIRASLTRKSNGEVKYIEKFNFTLGKDRTNVDYFIDSNSSISRKHASIVCENSEYFIMDNTSLNHTYVNGVQLIPNQKMKLNDGDTVVLANEVFQFNILNG